MSAEHLVEIAYELQKQLRAKEASAGKEKAVYEQRIELLEIRVKEAQERGENMKKMYEAMLSALKPVAGETSQIAKEILLINELHKKDLASIKQRHNEVVSSLNRQIDDLRNALAQYESENIKEQMKQSDVELSYKERLLDRDMRQRELEARIGKMEAERFRVHEGTIMNTKFASENDELGRVKEEHRKELNRIKDQYNNVFQEIKQIYQQERQMSEVKLERASKLIKTLQSQNEVSSKENLQEMLVEEIKELDRELQESKRNRLGEFIESKSEQCVSEKCNNRYGNYVDTRNATLEEENEQLRNQVSNLQAHVSKLEEKITIKPSDLGIRAISKELPYNKASRDLNRMEADYDMAYRQYCTEDKTELAKKLCIANKALKEMMERFAAMSDELNRTKEKCTILEEEQAKSEASLKTKVKSLISQVSNTKIRLFQSAEKLCRDENALRELRGILENRIISQQSTENHCINDTPKELSSEIGRRTKENDCSILKDSDSKVMNSTNNIFSIMESMSSREHDKKRANN